MRKIAVDDVRDLVEYEKVRERMRAEIIALKKNRRVSVGPNLTFLFENRETVLFQIQEMVRTERIVQEANLRDEVDSYNQLIPDPGQLSATLFIEIPDLHRMSLDEVRQNVNRFQGLDRDGVFLVVGGRRIPARFEEGHSNEEKMAAVHYLRFAVSSEDRAALADMATPVRLLIAHPNYKAEAEVATPVRQELLRDLAA
jgi:hypothetical protein